jgi:hypothetical protein
MNMSQSQSVRGGIWLRLMLVLGILFACLAVAWMILLPLVVTRWVRERTGFDIEIRALYFNPFTARLALGGLVITNPPTFPRRDFVDIREFRIDTQLFSLFGRRPVVDEAVVDVAEVAVVKNQEGLVNAALFQERLVGSSPSRPAATEKPPRDFLIRRLQVRFDRLVTADYSRRKPEVQEFHLNFNRSYENVTSMKQLTAPLADIFIPVAGAIDGMLPEAGVVLRAADDKIMETGRKAGETMKGLFEALEKTLKK